MIKRSGWRDCLGHKFGAIDTTSTRKHDNFPEAMQLAVLPLWSSHYSDVIIGATASQSQVSRLFTELFIHAQIKENIKASRHWPLCGEFTGHSPHKWPKTRNMSPFDDVIMV